MLVEILRHRNWDRQVLGALNDMARDYHAGQKMSQIKSKDGSKHTQSYVRPHVEQGPAEFLHRNRIHVTPYH